MFVTPVFVSRNVLDPAIYGSKRTSHVRVDPSGRLSIASSDTSSIDLHRTSSTSSQNSASTFSSTASAPSPKRTKHRKTFSGSSIHVPRLLFKKNRPAQLQRQDEVYQTPEPVVASAPSITSAPITPSIPVEPCTPAVVSSPVPTETSDWQCSDLVVRCKNDVYHVDRVIMCYHSKWFAKVCAVLMAPRKSKSVIDLSADDPDAVAAMMQYCYQLDYTDRLSGSDAAVPEAVTLRSHVDVFMLAERYGITGLKGIALQKFEDLAATVLMIDGNEEQLLEAIRVMYAPTRRSNAEDLKQVAVKLSANHVENFLSGSGRTMAIVFESMDSLPEFRADLFEEMASRWK